MDNNGQYKDYDYNPNDQYYYPNGQPFNQVPNGQTQGQQYNQQRQYQEQQPNSDQQFDQYQNPNQGQPFTPNADTSHDGSATGAMVCGILSVIPCCWGIIGIIFGIVAIVLYSSEKNNVSDAAKGKIKAGFVCGIVGVVLGVLGILISGLLGSIDLSSISQSM